MVRYNVFRNPTSAWESSRKLTRIRWDEAPSRTVMAASYGSYTRGHYWIEETDLPERPRDPAKPEYRVPPMAEIDRVRGSNGLTVVSTFSGCGGSCLGFEMAGYRVAMATEFVDVAAEAYTLNHPGVPVDRRDVREITARDVLDLTGLDVGELDVFEGSPPCSAFSTAGIREKGWGRVKNYSDGKAQRVDDLFFEWARLVEGLQPKAIVAENVPGLIRGAAKGYFKQIVAELRRIGYRVGARVLDASLLGVPQARKRLIFVGFRDDLDLGPVFPTPRPYQFTMADALPLDGDRVAPTPVDPDEWPTVLPVVEAAPGRREFTIPEVRRICGFPDDFQLTGSYRQRWERMGRAVPPPMMQAVAAEVAAALQGVRPCAG